MSLSENLGPNDFCKPLTREVEANAARIQADQGGSIWSARGEAINNLINNTYLEGVTFEVKSDGVYCVCKGKRCVDCLKR